MVREVVEVAVRRVEPERPRQRVPGALRGGQDVEYGPPRRRSCGVDAERQAHRARLGLVEERRACRVGHQGPWHARVGGRNGHWLVVLRPRGNDRQERSEHKTSRPDA